MTTWYIDPGSGTDSNASAGNGDSVGTARYKLDNIVAAALAPGDEIRYLKSPDPVSLGINATWESRAPKANINISSSTNATPIVVTTSSSHGLSAGDTVIIDNHATNTNANGVWKVGSPASTTFELLHEDGTNSTGNGSGSGGTVTDISMSNVRLASALTKSVACNGNQGELTNWTASANVTCTLSNDPYKEGSESQQIAIADGFTTGLAAYLTISSTDFSSYQKLTFWVYQSVGTLISSGQIQIKLCSDTAGATAVDTLDFPAIGMLGTWQPITIDKGSALGSAIQSVAIYAASDSGAQTFIIDNIQAANALHLKTAIGKATGNYLFPQSINGTRVILDADTGYCMPAVHAYSPGYYGTSETVAAYAQSMYSYGAGTYYYTATQTLQDTGTAGNPITITGGWNAGFTAQDGITWFDNENGRNYGLAMTNLNYITMDDQTIAFCRAYQGMPLTTIKQSSISLYAVNQCSNYGMVMLGAHEESTFGAVYVENNLVGVTSASLTKVNITNCNNSRQYNAVPSSGTKYVFQNCCNAGIYGIYVNGTYQPTVVQASNIKNNVQYGVYVQNSDISVLGATMSGNILADVGTISQTSKNGRFFGCNCSSSTLVTGLAVSDSSLAGIEFYNLDNTPDNNQLYLANGNITTDTTIVYSNLIEYSWKLSPTASSTYVNSLNPMQISLGKVKLKAGNNEVSAQLRRTNTGITGKLIIIGGQVPGIASDVTDSITAAADTWEKLVLSVAPTYDCEVEVLVQAYGGTTYSVYACDLQVKRGTISGNITETLDITDWMVSAHRADNGDYIGHTYTSSTSYSIDVSEVEPAIVTLSPRVHYKWSASKATTLDDFVVASVPDTTPHIWKCTTAGTTGGSEPTWNLSGTTTDNTTTWTYVAPLVDPKSLGPKIPVSL